MEIKDRIFWVQNPNSHLYNDGEYKVRLLNDLKTEYNMKTRTSIYRRHFAFAYVLL